MQVRAARAKVPLVLGHIASGRPAMAQSGHLPRPLRSRPARPGHSGVVKAAGKGQLGKNFTRRRNTRPAQPGSHGGAITREVPMSLVSRAGSSPPEKPAFIGAPTPSDAWCHGWEDLTSRTLKGDFESHIRTSLVQGHLCRETERSQPPPKSRRQIGTLGATQLPALNAAPFP